MSEEDGCGVGRGSFRVFRGPSATLLGFRTWLGDSQRHVSEEDGRRGGRGGFRVFRGPSVALLELQ